MLGVSSLAFRFLDYTLFLKNYTERKFIIYEATFFKSVIL